VKTIKTLVLGSAAVIAAVGGAQAADLPVKAKAVEYVRICSLYGAGFFYIPGTDTCVKIGGYLRADLTVNGANGGQPFYSGSGAFHDRYGNYYNDYSRFALTMDTRTATEYGVVRTFGQADFTFGTEGFGSINQQSTLNTLAQQGNVSANYVGQGQLGVEYAFVQFAGFTFGKSASAYTTPWQGFPGNNTAFLVGGYDTITGINNVQYTAQFGNGVSASIGIDDSSANDFNRTQVLNAVPTSNAASGNWGLYGAPSSAITAVGTAYTGAYVPDFVGNVRVDQAWGLFQVSGAAHWVDGGYYQNANTLGGQFANGFNNNGAMDSGHPDGKMGFAAMAGLPTKNIPTRPGGDFTIGGTWAKGATKYAIGPSGALGGSFYMFSNAAGGVGGKEAIGAISDGVYGGGPLNTSIQLTNSWGVRGAFNHNWDPYWSSSLFGGVTGVGYNSTAKTLWCTTYGLAAAAGGMAGVTTCDPGFTLAEIGITTRWTPVKNLTFSTEVMYAQLDTNMRGTVKGSQTSAFASSTGNYTFQNMGTVEAEFRVQRNF